MEVAQLKPRNAQLNPRDPHLKPRNPLLKPEHPHLRPQPLRIKNMHLTCQKYPSSGLRIVVSLFLLSPSTHPNMRNRKNPSKSLQSMKMNLNLRVYLLRSKNHIKVLRSIKTRIIIRTQMLRRKMNTQIISRNSQRPR